MHDHSHHHHDHSVQLKNVNAAFVIGIILNLAFVIAEVITGVFIKSISLLSDAGHNFADVASLALSLLAFRLMKVKSNERYTYGYKKTSVLVALFNAGILLASVILIIYQSVHRFFHPEVLPGKVVAIVAAIGIVINAVSAFLFFKNKENDLNVKSAYLHLLSDAIVSFGIVIGGIIIYFTNWYQLDAIIGVAIALVILFSTFSLFKSSLRLSLDGVPENIDLKKIKSAAQKIKGIKELHHIHVWAISTTENALTAHLVLEENITNEEEREIKVKLKHELLHQNIQHTTFETEWTNMPCIELSAEDGKMHHH